VLCSPMLPSVAARSGLGVSIADGMHRYYTEAADENGDAGQERVPFARMQGHDRHDHHGHGHTGNRYQQVSVGAGSYSALARRRGGAVAQWRSGTVAQLAQWYRCIARVRL
jgi:hypothetical protein